MAKLNWERARGTWRKRSLEEIAYTSGESRNWPKNRKHTKLHAYINSEDYQDDIAKTGKLFAEDTPELRRIRENADPRTCKNPAPDDEIPFPLA